MKISKQPKSVLDSLDADTLRRFEEFIRERPEELDSIDDDKRKFIEEYFNVISKEDAEKHKEQISQEARQKRADERRRLEAMPPEFVIHTVHGTFGKYGKRAKWIYATSAFCKYLHEQLGWRVRIEPFEWDGKNLFESRQAAAADLRKRLAEKTDVYSDAKHVVIAHSHGGNVAMSAIATDELAADVLGVATLGTPFLTAEPRRAVDFMDPGTMLFAALAAGWTMLFVGVSRGVGWAWWPWALATAVGVIAILALGALLVELMQRHAQAISESIDKTALSSEQVVIIRTQGDEAAATLAGVRLAGTASDLMWSALSKPIFKILGKVLDSMDFGRVRSIDGRRELLNRQLLDRLEGSGQGRENELFGHAASDGESDGNSYWKEASNTIYQFLPIIIIQLLIEAGPTAQSWTMAAIILYGLPALLALAAVLFGVPFALISGLSLVVCGWKAVFAGPYLHLTADPLPPGSWSLTQFRAGVSENGLAHSKAYRDPEVMEFLVTWIRQRVSQSAKLAADKGRKPEHGSN
jgi:hypothetical protein